MAVAALAVVVVASCGSSGEAGSSGISKAAFIRKANAICEVTQNKLLYKGIRVLRKLSRGRTKEETGDIFVPKWFFPIVEDEIEDVRALGAPSGDEAKIDAILDELQRVLDEDKANPKKFQEEQGEFSLPYRKVERLSKEYGIDACGHP